MNKIKALFLVALAWSGKVISDTHSTEVITNEICYTDVKICALYKVNSIGGTVEMILKDKDAWILDSAKIAEYADMGIKVSSVSVLNYNVKKAALKATQGNLVTRNTTVEKEATDLASISDEAWDVIEQSSYCGIGVVGCGGSAFLTAETGGLTLLVMKSACVGVGVQCTSAIRSYQKWKKFQQKKDQEESGGANPPQDNNPGSTGDAPPGDGGESRPGRPIGGGADCRHCTVQDLPS